MRSSPKNGLARKLSSRFIFLPVLLTFALSLLLMACSGANAGTPSSPAGTTTPQTGKTTLSPAPATINFGTVLLNSQAVTSVVSLTNVGTSVEIITSATIAPTSVFSIVSWTSPVSLNPGQTYQLRTVFTPKNAGTYAGTLTLVTLHETLPEPAGPPVIVGTTEPVPRISQLEISVIGTASAENTPPPVGVGVLVSPSSLALQSGQSKQFTATVTGTVNTAVTWTARLGSITSSGDYTAPIVTSQSSDTVSTISVADSTKYASSTVTITSTPSTGAAYSQNANSVTTKALPSDVLSHCFGDSSNCAAGDAIAQCALTDCGGLSELSNPAYMGNFLKASPGSSDLTDAFYSSASTDPWYSITAATPTGSHAFTFHAPNAAKFPEGVECEITVWDQSTGYVLGIYSSGCTGGGVTLPAASSCGSSSSNACAISGFTYKSISSNLFSSQDYDYTTAAQSSGQFAPAAGMIREQELQNGSINHALLFTVDCVNSATPFVFPGIAPALGQCGSGYFGPQNANRPSADTLLFLDYTPAQIASFNLPAWQATILTAFATYGGYVDITQGVNQGIGIGSDEEIESTEAWKYSNASVGCSGTNCYNDPFWPWITGQRGLDGSVNLSHVGCIGGSGANASQYRCIGAILANIPRAIGPEGSDTEGNSCTSGAGCYPSGHIHVADSCIAKGFANLPGGCS